MKENTGPKIAEEQTTVCYMIDLYFKKFPAENQSGEKEALKSYAQKRLARCPYGEAKPACRACPIHCYKPEMKQLMQKVMRYAGPRMLFHHPILALKHLQKEIKGRKAGAKHGKN